MQATKFSDWVQLVTASAVLLGMGLLIWELRQTREIAQVQHSQAGIGFFAQSVHSAMGEDAAKSIAKACDHPDELATEDMIVLSLYYTSVINRVRQVRNANLISEDLLPLRWTQYANANFEEIFSTEYGRWWWNRATWEPEIKQAGNEYLAETNAPDCAGFFDLYRDRKSKN